jgi:predicted outer membrane repeat protein
MIVRTLLLSAGIALTSAVTVAAATINVTSTANSPGGAGDCTLGEAITAANSDAAVDGCTAGSGSDTISVPAGTYTLTAALPQINSVVIVQGAGSASTIITRDLLAAAFRIFDASGGSADFTLNDVEVSNGIGDDGGGVYTRGRPLVVNDALFRNNSATNRGGAIATGGFLGTTTINDSTFVDNHGDSEGGAIQIGGALTVTSSTFTSNDTADSGGAIRHGGGTATITSTTIADNSAGTTGGGIAGGFLAAPSIVFITTSVISGNTSGQEGGGGAFATATITDSRVFGNTSSTFGGGLHFGDSSTVTGSTLNDNQATFGGGIANRGNSGAVVTIINSTISGNAATADGGGLYVDIGGTFDLENATVTNNIADSDANGSGDGGGVFRGSAVDVFLQNTILAGNHDGLEVGITKTDSDDPATVGTPFTYTLTVTKTGSNPDCSGDVTSNGNNVIGVTDGCTVTLQPSDIAGTGAAPVDPELGPPVRPRRMRWRPAVRPSTPARDVRASISAASAVRSARPATSARTRVLLRRRRPVLQPASPFPMRCPPR